MIDIAGDNGSELYHKISYLIVIFNSRGNALWRD